jgi:putative oxygen-independent coproporphyrinogen III oxidase
MSGVYISYPFCGQKCTYCNFATGVFPAALQGDYIVALQREIERHDWQWAPDTVYLGGGSPNRMAVEDLARTLDAIPGRPWREATIEAAPGEISADLARSWAKIGINRVSLGVQSFVETELRRTGRRHTAEVVDRDIEKLRAAGIENINVDLIAGLPGQTETSWRSSLDWVARLAPSHVSIYMLEVDEESRLGAEILREGARYGAQDVPADAEIAAFYEIAVDELARTGVSRYEISNFARPGFESRHNLKYWRLEPYVGFGADAHSFDAGLRWQNVATAREYAAAPDPRAESCEPSPNERFWVGLRLSEGVRLAPEDWARFDGPIQRFEEAGLLERSGEALRLTRQGVLLSNEVFQEFLA